MALVVNQQPDKYTPAFSPQVFQATSTNTASPGHTYTVVWTDIITGLTGTEQVYADPVYDSMVWDASDKSSNFIQYFTPLYTGGWQKATGSIRPFRVNIGETYGGVYYPGTDYDFTTWSGIVDFLGFANGVFDSARYIYNAGVNHVYMAGVLDDIGYAGRSNYLYVLSNHYTGARIGGIHIVTYNAAGGVIGISDIANPHAAGGNTYDKNFVLIDVGSRGLDALTAPQVTGTFPVLSASVAKYEIYNLAAPQTLIKTITLGCENKYRAMLVHYLAKNGAMQTANFSLIHNKTLSTQSQKYGKNPNVNTGTFYSYPINSQPNKKFGIVSQTQLKLRTDWLSDDQISKYKELWDSPLCLLDGDADYPNNQIAIEPVTPNYIDIPHYENNLVKMENDFIYCHENLRQRV